MSTEKDSLSLEVRVAKTIIDRLVADRLLHMSQVDRAVDRLAGGTMKDVDWRFLAEQALHLQEQDSQDE